MAPDWVAVGDSISGLRRGGRNGSGLTSISRAARSKPESVSTRLSRLNKIHHHTQDSFTNTNFPQLFTHTNIPYILEALHTTTTMGSVTVDDNFSTADFGVLEDCRPDDHTLQAFMVSKPRGFLPRADPVWKLPSDFDPLEDILQRMPVKTASGEPGLLAQGKLGATVEADFPDLTWAVDKHADDKPLMNALYRDYSFLLSAYLLEPCHERFLRGEPYGLGRQSLPAVIARPMARVAEL